MVLPIREAFLMLVFSVSLGTKGRTIKYLDIRLKFNAIT